MPQYLLTEDEYQKLKESAERQSDESRESINELCTMVADHMPIERDWAPDAPPSPWGCVVTANLEHVCDDCPVQHMCLRPKKWSK